MKHLKRILAFLLCAAMVFGLLPTVFAYDSETEFAYAVEGGNIYISSIDGGVMSCDPSVTAADIPDEADGMVIEYIAANAFADCAELTSVSLPESILRIEEYAFFGCSALESISLTEGLEEIGPGAFSGCSALAEITIPSTVTYIGAEVFIDCVSLTSLIVDEENEYYLADEHNVLYTKDMLELVAFSASYEGAYEIPEGVEIIGCMAFSCCYGLTEITIPDTVIEVCDAAFSFCEALTEVTIPESVCSIGENAFEACVALESISVLNPECDIYPSSETLGNRDVTTVYGYKDSTAAAYAEEFAFTFSVFECEEHTVQFVEAAQATCLRDGCISHWCCSVCGRYYADEEASQELAAVEVFIERLPHNYDEDNTCIDCGCGLPFVIDMADSGNDGWSYNTIEVYEDGYLVAELTLKSGAEGSATVDYREDCEYYFVWKEAAWPEECSFTISQADEVLYDSADQTLFGNMTFFAICNHRWIDATCDTPKTCEKCNLFEGEAPGHDYDAVVKEETCLEEGYTTYTCTVCGDSYTDDYQLPADHDYVAVVTEPTCTEGGYTTYTCSYCGDSYVTDEVPPMHNLVDNVCTICGAVSPILIEMYDEWGDGWNGNILLVYENGELIMELTFTDGSEMMASVDYHEDSEYYFEWSEGVNANECSFTIVQNGEILYEVADASTLSDGQTVFAICEHSWCEATCSEPKVCEKCNMTEGEALGHSYNDEELCEVCGAYIPFVIEMKDIWGNGWTDNKLLVYENGEFIAALTVESGAESSATVDYHPDSEYYFVWQEGACPDECAYTISRNGEILFEVSNAVMHTDGETVFAICEHILSDADCENPQICEKCNLHVGMSLGHTYTYENIGETHIVGCEVCDYTEEVAHNFIAGDCICGQPKDPLENFDEDLVFSMNITAGAEMVVNYNFMAGAVSQYDDFYLVVEKDVAGGDLVTTTYGTLDYHIPLGNMPHPVTGEPMMYNAAYTGINAKEMGDSFSTTLYAIDTTGRVYHGETVTSSIQEFLLGKLESETSIAERKTMAVDMLKYGAAAQINFDYDTDNLVTDVLTDEQLALGTQEIPEAANYASESGSGANVRSSITVNSKVELALSCIVAGQINPAGIKCVITDADGKVLAELATVNIGGVMYSATYDNVGASQMREVISATFYNEEGAAVSKTVHWSVESYVAQVRANSTSTETEIAMVNAMLTYGDAVAVYMEAK